MRSRNDATRGGQPAVAVRPPLMKTVVPRPTHGSARIANQVITPSDAATPTATALYLSEIGHTRLLRPAEEVALAQRIAHGDTEAAQTMAQANLRLVVTIASRYRACGLPLEDLIAEGNIGLLHAVQKYDWQRGFRFSTYAVWWIRQSITRAIANHGHAIRVPVHLGEALARRARAVDELSHALGRQPTAAELAAIPGPDKHHACAATSATQIPLPLDMPVGETGNESLADVLRDESAPLPEDEAIRRITREETSRVLREVLTERERAVIVLRYGFDGRAPQPLDAIGTYLGVTRERVRQIEAAALRKLRQPAVMARLGATGPRSVA